MHSPLDAYLVSLRNEMDRRLGKSEAAPRFEELEAHVREKALAYRELGISPEAAEMEAVLAFGMPWEVAQGFQPTKRRLPLWFGEALMILAGAFVHFLPHSTPFWLFAFLLMLNAPVLCRWFPVFGFSVAIFEGWWYVQSGPADLRHPSRYDANMLPAAYWMVGAFVVGHLARWIWNTLKGRKLVVRLETVD